MSIYVVYHRYDNAGLLYLVLFALAVGNLTVRSAPHSTYVCRGLDLNSPCSWAIQKIDRNPVPGQLCDGVLTQLDRVTLPQ